MTVAIDAQGHQDRRQHECNQRPLGQGQAEDRWVGGAAKAVDLEAQGKHLGQGQVVNDRLQHIDAATDLGKELGVHMVAGRSHATQGAEHHQPFEERQRALGAHGRADEREERNQQQGVALQNAQRARCFAQYHLHVQRPANQRQADDAQQHQKAPLPA